MSPMQTLDESSICSFTAAAFTQTPQLLSTDTNLTAVGQSRFLESLK